MLSLWGVIRARGAWKLVAACWMLSRARQGRQRKVDMVDGRGRELGAVRCGYMNGHVMSLETTVTGLMG